jgi:hypothetical protein
MSERGTVSLEKMHHFRCKECNRWWSIADIPVEPETRLWYCPWCGKEQAFDNKTPKVLS